MSFRTGFVRLALLALSAIALAACDHTPNAAATAPAAAPTLESITLTVASKTLAVGGTIALNVSGSFSDGASKAITATYASSAASVATVSSTGVVTAVGPGSATITITSGSQSAFFAVTVEAGAPALRSLSVNLTALTEAIGGTAVLIVTGNYSDGSKANVTDEVSFSSSAPGVAEVTGPGNILGVAAGTATITVTGSGQTSTVAVTVTSTTLAGISATPSVVELALGGTIAIAVTGTDSTGATTPLTATSTFTSADSTIASVSSGGIVTAVSAGSTTILVKNAGLTASVAVTVQGPALVSLAVTPSPLTEIVATSTPLQVIGTYSDSSTRNVTALASYASSATGIATVSAAGIVTGVAPGPAIVTVSYLGISAPTVAVTITPAVLASIAVAPANATLAVAGTVALTVTGTYNNNTTAPVTQAAAFGTDASSVATVSAAGVVTAVGAGSATITASYGGFNATMSVTVSTSAPTLTLLSILPTAITAYVGGTTQLAVTGHYSDGSTQNLTTLVSYTTSAGSVATVSATGLVTATGAGSATVTASSSGKAVSVTVTVPALASIAVAPTSAALGVGGTIQLTVTGTFSDSSTANVTSASSFSTSASSVATVSASGLVTAVGAGSATITATDSAKQATMSVTVGCCTGASAYEVFASTFSVPATIVAGGPSGSSVQGGEFYVFYSPYYAYGCAASTATGSASPADTGYYYVQGVAQETYCGQYSGSGGSFSSTDYFEIAFNGPTINSVIQPIPISQSTNMLIRTGNVTTVSTLNGTAGIFTAEMSNTNGTTTGTDICDADVTLLAHGPNTSASQSGLLDYQVPFSAFACSAGSVSHLQQTGVYQVVVKVLAAKNSKIAVNSFDAIAVSLIGFDVLPTASPGPSAPSGWGLFSASYTVPSSIPPDQHVALSAQGGEMFAFYNGAYGYGGSGSGSAGQAALNAAGFYYLQVKETATPSGADSVGLALLAPQPTPGTPTPIDISQSNYLLVRMGNTQPPVGSNGQAKVFTVEMSDPIGGAAAADVCAVNITLDGIGPNPTYSTTGLNDYWIPFSSFTCGAGTLAHLQSTGVYNAAIKILPSVAGNAGIVSGSLDEMAVQYIGFTH